MIIDIRKEGKGPYRAVGVFPNGTEVHLFNSGFQETAIYQAFARSGQVRLNNQPIEDPFKKRPKNER